MNKREGLGCQPPLDVLKSQAPPNLGEGHYKWVAEEGKELEGPLTIFRMAALECSAAVAISSRDSIGREVR